MYKHLRLMYTPL